MVKTTIRFPEKLYTELKHQSRKRGMTLNAYILSILWKYADINAEEKQELTN